MQHAAAVLPRVTTSRRKRQSQLFVFYFSNPTIGSSFSYHIYFANFLQQYFKI